MVDMPLPVNIAIIVHIQLTCSLKLLPRFYSPSHVITTSKYIGPTYHLCTIPIQLLNILINKSEQCRIFLKLKVYGYTSMFSNGDDVRDFLFAYS